MCPNVTDCLVDEEKLQQTDLFKPAHIFEIRGTLQGEIEH